MPITINRAGYPAYDDNEEYHLQPVLPALRPSRPPSPRSPSPNAMYLDAGFNYYHPASGYVGVPMLPSFIPLPASPSMLSPTFVPLPPSPRGSPRRPLSPLPPSPRSPSAMPYPAYPQYTHPFDPYYFPQSGPRYMNPEYAPRRRLHPLLDEEGYVFMDLSRHKFEPLTPSASSGNRKLIPIHEGYLTQVASSPKVTEMNIICAEFGKFMESWIVKVKPGRNVEVGDVLYATYRSLQKPMTHAEWAKLSEEEVLCASRMYTRRVRKADFEKVNGVRRVDLLGEKFWFGGIEGVNERDPYNFQLILLKAK